MISTAKDKYYTSFDYLLSVFDENSRNYAFKAESIDEYNVWKKQLVDILKNITGINKMKKCDLKPKLLESIKMNGYRRDKILIQTEINVMMPFYLLVPEGVDSLNKRSCIIAAHGHGSCGKEAVAGRTDIPLIDKITKGGTLSYGLNLVKEGYIVLCPDARGAGERRELMEQGEEENKLFSSSCNNLNNAAISIGRTLTGMQVWDLMRLIDYIEASDICSSNKIGCCGFSGGGLQTIWLSALDDRVKCAYDSGYFHGFRDTILKQHLCGCNFVPHLWETIDMGDLGALVAPRPLIIETGSDDHLNGPRRVENVNEQFEITKSAYSLFNAKDKLYHNIFQGSHEWNGGKISEFFDKWLGK